MKKVFGILMMTLLATASVSAQNSIYKAVVGAHKNTAGNIVVSDPSTTLAVDLTIETEQVVVGPYAKYAQKYLETRGTLVDKKTTAVTSAKIAIVADDALMADKIAEPETVVTSYMGSEVEFPKISPDRTSSSAMSLDDAAAEAAQAIYRIRKNRMELISGEAGENVFGGGLKDALAELDAKEQAYLELFLGKKVVKNRTERIIIPVVAGVNEYPISNLIAGENKIQGITLTLTPSEATPKFSTLSEVDPRDKTAIAVRIANIATCTVKAGDKVIGSASLPIFELGRTAYIAGAVK
jgi:hypothetical protein